MRYYEKDNKSRNSSGRSRHKGFAGVKVGCLRKCSTLLTSPRYSISLKEELAAGITDILIITNRGKGAIEDHFDHSFELEKNLEGNAAKRDLYESVLACSDIADIYFKRQKGD